MKNSASVSGSADRAGSQQSGLPLRLSRMYSDLTRSERRIADFVVQHPRELATFSARELAECSGVSAATVSRLIRRLGYASYEEARREARTLRDTGSPFHLFAPSPGPGDVIARQAAEEIHLLESTFAMAEAEQVRDAARALARAPTLWFTGFRNSRFLADYACALFTSLRGATATLAPTGQTLAEGVAGVGPGDVVLAFGLRRRVAQFARLLDALRETGADVLLVADAGMSPPAGLCRWTFRCTVATRQAFDGYGGALALVRMLALETMYELGATAEKRLGRIEAIQSRLGELD